MAYVSRYAHLELFDEFSKIFGIPPINVDLTNLEKLKRKLNLVVYELPLSAKSKGYWVSNNESLPDIYINSKLPADIKAVTAFHEVAEWLACESHFGYFDAALFYGSPVTLSPKNEWGQWFLEKPYGEIISYFIALQDFLIREEVTWLFCISVAQEQDMMLKKIYKGKEQEVLTKILMYIGNNLSDVEHVREFCGVFVTEVIVASDDVDWGSDMARTHEMRDKLKDIFTKSLTCRLYELDGIDFMYRDKRKSAIIHLLRPVIRDCLGLKYTDTHNWAGGRPRRLS